MTLQEAAETCSRLGLKMCCGTHDLFVKVGDVLPALEDWPPIQILRELSYEEFVTWLKMTGCPKEDIPTPDEPLKYFEVEALD